MRMRTKTCRESPTIQVQIVTHNSVDCIAACLRSVLRQTVPIRRVLVIDNASTDGTTDVVESFGSHCTLLRLEKNCGYAAGHNIGFSEAKDDIDYVLTLNPDVILEPNYLSMLLDASMVSPKCGGLTGKLLRHGGAHSTNEIPVVDSAGLVMERFFHVRDRGAGQQDDGTYTVTDWPWGICGAAGLYRTTMLKDIQLPNGDVLDTRFFLYKEDVDLCWRARRRGWTFCFIPDAIAHHRRTWVRGTRMPAVAASHSFANQIALVIRHCPGWTAYLLVSLAVECGRFSLLLGTRPLVALRAASIIVRDWRYHWSCRTWLAEHDNIEPGALYDLCRIAHV